MSILSILAMTFGVASGFANIFQWIKIFQRKSAKDISIITYLLLFMGAVIWVFYGFEIHDLPVILTNAVGGINIGIVIVGWMLFH
jgi:MtN3 and saliva related transmembrane protein